MKKGLCVGLSILIVFLTACAGRDADPVPVYRPGDEEMTCRDLKAEMAHVESRVSVLVPESKKTGKNVLLGTAGVFLIFPWFFMDMSSAEKTEIKAYNERYLALERLYRRKCTDGAGGAKAVDAPTGAKGVGERLKALDQLKQDGLITDEEYSARKKEILSEI
jgi:hypothetical protein